MDYESGMSWINFCFRWDLGRCESLQSSRSSRNARGWFWRRGQFDRGWNKEAEKITICQNFSSFSASAAKCINLKGLFGSRLQSNVVGAGFQRWYVSFEMGIFLMALHGGSSIPLFCFRPLFRRSHYHSDQRNRSPAGHSLSFDLYWGVGTNSWTYCDELVLLVFIVIYCFLSLVLFVVQQSVLLTHMIFVSIRQIFHARLLFTGLDDVLCRLEQVEQRPSSAVFRLGDTNDTSGNESNMGESRRRLRSKKTYKMKKTWGLVVLGSSLWLSPQILRQNLAISNAVFVARTSLCSFMVTTKFCGTSRAANTFPATNVRGRGRHAGKCWIMRGMPWVQQKQSDNPNWCSGPEF